MLLCGLSALAFYGVYSFHYIILFAGIFCPPMRPSALESRDYVVSISVFPMPRFSKVHGKSLN